MMQKENWSPHICQCQSSLLRRRQGVLYNILPNLDQLLPLKQHFSPRMDQSKTAFHFWKASRASFAPRDSSNHALIVQSATSFSSGSFTLFCIS